MAETISETLRQKLTTTAAGRCEYCQSPESFATERFSIEHIELRAVGGLTVPENPALACQGCNGHKSAKTAAVDHDDKPAPRLDCGQSTSARLKKDNSSVVLDSSSLKLSPKTFKHLPQFCDFGF